MSRPRLIGLLLALVTLLAFWPVAHNGFVNYDDNEYVTENRVVQHGLTWAGIRWAFTTEYTGYWHPVTWLSHMLDCEWFGLNAGAHHSVNLLFHAANTVLLFLLLLRLTRELWPSAFVAALFAWHPLHVETVAWISERKDVLSTFFALLSLLAYTRYAQRVASDQEPDPAVSRFTFHVSRFYWLALAFFALGLMSKPMLVTLPLVMLLLDYWPLGRMAGVESQGSGVLRLVLEKWPFFLLTIISCIVTYLGQSCEGVALTIQQFPLFPRLANALTSYGQYLGKTFWPSGLAVFYPLPNHWSWVWGMMAATAVGLLLVLSWLVWRAHRPCPYLLVGWLWYLGTLVPVIGLVQVGSAAMADRYTYFPLVGVFIAVAFGVRDLANRFQFPKAVVAVAAAGTLALCLMLTENQLRYWRDSELLFAHTLAVSAEENPSAQINYIYGAALEEKGRLVEALAQYREAACIVPGNVELRYDIGNTLDKMGRPEEALPELLLAVQLNPKLPPVRDTLGNVLVELGRFDEALDQFTEAVRLDPACPAAHFDLGKLLLKQGHDAGAMDEFRAALWLDPDNFQTLAYTAHVLAAIDNPQIRDGKTALALAIRATLTGGAQPFVLDALGMACAETGHFDDARKATQKAVDLAIAAKMKNLEPMQQRLELYRNQQPWRESFLSTNLPPEEGPKK